MGRSVTIRAGVSDIGLFQTSLGAKCLAAIVHAQPPGAEKGRVPDRIAAFLVPCFNRVFIFRLLV